MDFFSMLAAISAGPAPVVARSDVNGLTVSTVNTIDAGYETAILDANGTHPVERYATEEAAKKGHRAWVTKARTLTTIRKLGYGDLIDEDELTVEREK